MTDIELKNEYKERLEENFKKLNPYSYGSKIWESIEEKKKELSQKIDEIPFVELKEIRIDGEDYLLEFDDFVKKQRTLSVKLGSREAFIRKMQELNDRIGTVASSVWKKIKFVFSIPALAFASFVFSYAIVLVFSIPLNLIFPIGFSEEYSGLIEAIIAAIIFIVLKTLLILDSHDRYLEENWILYIIKYLIMVSIYWTIFYAIRYTTKETVYAFNYFEWAIYLPFLWLGGIVHEFFRAGVIGYFIVTLLPVLISVPIILLREYGIHKTHKKNIEYEEQKELEEDNFHFDENVKLEYLGQNKNNETKN